MREIKCRAWFENSQTFVYYGVGYPMGGESLDIYNDLCVQGVKWDQFTGLKDKNGIDIFEGDVIKMIDEWYELDSLTSGFTGVVVFDDGSFVVEGDNKEYMCLDQCSISNCEYEVIGNIHDKN